MRLAHLKEVRESTRRLLRDMDGYTDYATTDKGNNILSRCIQGAITEAFVNNPTGSLQAIEVRVPVPVHTISISMKVTPTGVVFNTPEPETKESE